MIKNILKKEFVKNFLTLFTGTTLAQGILFLILPLLSRLYSDELFGLYFVFMSIVMVLKIVTTLRFELSIVLPKDDKDAVNLVFTTLFLNFTLSVFFAIIIFVFYDFINSLLGEKNLGKYLYLIPLSTFLTGFYEIFNHWNNRNKKYKNISYSKILKSSTTGTWNIGFGFSFFKKFGLIPGQIFGSFISGLFLFVISYKEISKLTRYVSIKRIKFLIKKYRYIPQFNTIINFIVNISNEAPILLLTNFFGVSAVGLYGMANRLIGTPSDLVSKSVGQVFFQKASEIYNNKGDLYSFLKKTYLNLLKIALIIFIPAMLITPFLKYILGAEWLQTSYYALLIIPLIFTKFIKNPVSSIFVVLNEQKKIILYSVIDLFFRIISLYIGYKIFGNPFVAVGFFVITSIIYNLVLIFLFLRMTKNYNKNNKLNFKNS